MDETADAMDETRPAARDDAMDETRPAARAAPSRARPRSAAPTTVYSATGERMTCRALIKADERKMRIHHSRLQSAKPLVSTRARAGTQQRANPKRRQAERERQADIARQNRHLVDRMLSILDQPSDYSRARLATYGEAAGEYRPTSLNIRARRDALRRIEAENFAIMRRIEDSRATYGAADLKPPPSWTPTHVRARDPAARAAREERSRAASRPDWDLAAAAWGPDPGRQG